MKMKTAIISLVLAPIMAIAAIYITVFSVMFIVNTGCRNLESISGDRELMSNLWEQISDVIEEHAQLEKTRIALGVRYARDVENGFRIDWEALSIPLDVATIRMGGKSLRTDELDPRLIDEVRVGYGYRYHLVFSMKEGPESRNPDALKWSYDLSVECRDP